MKIKKKFRERAFNYTTPFEVIKDLDKQKINANKEKITELNNIQNDLYKVLEYYEKRKKKEIPKAKIIHEKNVNMNNLYINNNIIYKNENHSNINLNNDEYKLNYKLSEYKRPNNYIIYSSYERNKIKETKKEYEAKEADFFFLKIRHNCMKIEELENIIIDIENNATDNKDEKIDEEKAKNIIKTKYSKYENYADSIINHIKDRRFTIKNSLLRKKWHRDKTFQIRKVGMIKTRKNTHNLNESLNKIIEAEEICKANILPIINDLLLKANLDRNLLKIEEYIFQSECDQIKGTITPESRIKDKNMLKENVKEIFKKINDNQSIDKKLEIDENSFKEQNINKNSNNSTNPNSNENNGNNSPTDKTKNEIKKTTDLNKNINNELKNNNEKKINKNILKSKNDILFPSLSLDILKNENNYNSNDNYYLNNKTQRYRVRIRLNRSNNITVDRYIQVNNDFNPFHDSFNKIINNYRRFNNSECKINSLKNKNFENLLNDYNYNYIQNLSLEESDDDSYIFNNDMKQFSNSYKQFIKAKKAHI